ncbi:MAG: hypothetical protein AUF76_12000 [Acidobacteria bacterium 13_1_20CM_2_65_9]|nr:MAG: hypothetical protein AUF76_12000 [Acidobacteria bacterium 13_1_20CM_2_65_9]
MLAGDVGPREPRAVGHPVPVFAAEDRQDHQVQPVTAHDARRSIGIARHLDLDRSLVDDDDDEDLRGIGDRREALEHLHALEALGRAQPRRDLVDGRRLDAHADLDARELADLLVRRRGVAVDLDRGNDLHL